MGNSTSAQGGVESSDAIRKSTASDQVRKASGGGGDVKASLDEEFSDLILHQVKRTPPKDETNIVVNEVLKPISTGAVQDGTINLFGSKFDRFTDDLIEDEFNELNDGLLDTDVQELSRIIIPQNPEDFDIHSNSSSSLSDGMDIDDHEDKKSPTPDINNVDFTKLAHPNPIDATHGISLTNGRGTLIPIEIKWMNNAKETINKVSIIGSFSNWKDVIYLSQSKYNPLEYSTTISLPLGVHKLLYMINNEYRVSELLPTATDQEGIFFNWFEVLDESHLFNHPANQPDNIGYDANIRMDSPNHPFQTTLPAGKRQVDEILEKNASFLTKVSKETSNFEHIEYMDESDPQPSTTQEHGLAPPPPIQDANSLSTSHGNNNKIYNSGYNSSTNSFAHIPSKPEYSNEIPEMFINYDYFRNKSPSYELPEPPQLPAHLNNVLLNKLSNNNNSNQNSSSQLQSIPQIPPTHTSKPSDPYTQPENPTPRRPALRRADSSYYASNNQSYHLSIPNHVILNHLMTSSIRNDVLTVACITRYSGKFITQIMHSPAETKNDKAQ
jgi:hypothetical protein